MSYNLKESTVTRWAPTLDLLVESSKTIHMRSPKPKALAYHLREALAAARHLEIEPYASLRYRFEVLHNHIIARHPDALPKELITDIEHLDGMYLKAVSDYDVVAMVGTDPQKLMVFPTFKGDLEVIKIWAENTGLTVTDTDPLTLEKK